MISYEILKVSLIPIWILIKSMIVQSSVENYLIKNKAVCLQLSKKNVLSFEDFITLFEEQWKLVVWTVEERKCVDGN